MRPNPAWADKILYSNWPKLRAFAEENGVPPPDPHLTAKRKIEWVEYGCGNWGCTYPTNVDEVVCKLTSDPTEVRAVVDIAELPKSADLEGIVEYYALLPLRGRHVAEGEAKSTPVYAIWREAAQCMGNVELAAKRAKVAGEPKELVDRMNATWQLLLNQQTCAFYLKRLHNSQRSPAQFMRAVESQIGEGRLEAESDRRVLTRLVRDKFYKTRSRVIDPEGSDVEQAAYLWGAIELLGREIEELDIMPEVARTITSMMHHGVLLADVHDANVCHVTRDGHTLYAIIDPGNAVKLGTRGERRVTKPYRWTETRRAMRRRAARLRTRR